MIYELIQPNQIHNTESDLENDLNKWTHEDSICFDVEINQTELQNINDRIERNCIRASHSKYHTQIMDLLRWWRSTLRTRINQLSYTSKEELVQRNGFYYYDTPIGELVCTIEQNPTNRPTLYVEYIIYKPISKTCFNGKTYKIKLIESHLDTPLDIDNIISETINDYLRNNLLIA